MCIYDSLLETPPGRWVLPWCRNVAACGPLAHPRATGWYPRALWTREDLLQQSGSYLLTNLVHFPISSLTCPDIMNDETQRKYIQSVKRVITFVQKNHPN